jgi:hypothetical protein
MFSTGHEGILTDNSLGAEAGHRVLGIDHVKICVRRDAEHGTRDACAPKRPITVPISDSDINMFYTEHGGILPDNGLGAETGHRVLGIDHVKIDVLRKQNIGPFRGFCPIRYVITTRVDDNGGN